MRKMIKENAKAAFRMHYWPMVGVELVAGALMGTGYSFSTTFSRGDMKDVQEFVQNNEWMQKLIGPIIGISIAAVVIGLLYAFLFGNVIQVGVSGIRLNVYRGQGFRFVDLFSGLKQYWRIVGTMALYTLFVTLGFLCFFIPGIIVSLGLFEVPFLLADDPNLSGMDAIKKSWEDMRGHKGELFGFGLSFIGWILLSILTMGVLAIFYTGPYMSIAHAGFYHELHANEQTAA